MISAVLMVLSSTRIRYFYAADCFPRIVCLPWNIGLYCVVFHVLSFYSSNTYLTLIVISVFQPCFWLWVFFSSFDLKMQTCIDLVHLQPVFKLGIKFVLWTAGVFVYSHTKALVAINCEYLILFLTIFSCLIIRWTKRFTWIYVLVMSSVLGSEYLVILIPIHSLPLLILIFPCFMT